MAGSVGSASHVSGQCRWWGSLAGSAGSADGGGHWLVLAEWAVLAAGIVSCFSLPEQLQVV